MSAIQLIDLKTQQQRIKDKIDVAIQKVLAHGAYVLGPEVQELEQELARYTGAKKVITCANGTDALTLALRTKQLDSQSAVFVPPFTFAATAEVVADIGAVPFFVDVDKDTFNLCPVSLKSAIIAAKKQGLKPAGVIPVDIFGNPADYIAIHEIASENNCWVIADAAQSFGASLKGKQSGNLAPISTTSFFPAKPLGCYGDGGAIFVQDEELAEQLVSLRNHGAGEHRYDHVAIGQNSRLDSIQAAILLEKIKIFDEELQAKTELAQFYNQNLPKGCKPQLIQTDSQSAYAIYTIVAGDLRDTLCEQLREANIPAPVYYHIPLHQQVIYQQYPRASLANAEWLCKQVISLPMHAYVTQAQRDQIATVLAKAAEPALA